jgi:hypothetical protein
MNPFTKTPPLTLATRGPKNKGPPPILGDPAAPDWSLIRCCALCHQSGDSRRILCRRDAVPRLKVSTPCSVPVGGSALRFLTLSEFKASKLSADHARHRHHPTINKPPASRTQHHLC